VEAVAECPMNDASGQQVSNFPQSGSIRPAVARRPTGKTLSNRPEFQKNLTKV